MKEDEFRDEVRRRAAVLSKKDRQVVSKILNYPLTNEECICYNETVRIECECRRFLGVEQDGKILLRCPRCKKLHEVNIRAENH